MAPRIDGLSGRARSAYDEFLQTYGDVPLTSAYRDPAYNAKVGGAKGSAHVHGDAMDFSVRGLDEAQKAEVVNWWREKGARGLGYYPNSDSIHVDMREGPNRAWGPNYSHTSLDQTPGWFQAIASEHRGAPSDGVSYSRPLETGPAKMAGYPSNATGGLGGLGGYQEPRQEKPGFFQSDKFGNVLQAVGLSLMSAPSNAPLSRVGDFLPGIQQQTMKKNMLAQEQAKENRTLGYLRQNFPDIAAQVDAGLPVTEAFRMATSGGDLTASQKEFRMAQENPEYAEFLQRRGSNPGLQMKTLPDGTYGTFDPASGAFEPLGSAPKSSSGGVEIELPDGTRFSSGGTEGQRRNQQLYSVIQPELETVERTFDAMGEIGNQAAGAMGTPGNFIASPEYQMGRNALQTVISSYLYSVSGATANPGEVATQTDMLLPKPGDSPQTLEMKKQRVRTMVRAVGIAAGATGSGGDQPAVGAGGAGGGGANRTANGLSWSVN